jgi:3-phenylpropionate/trans-cinnamate dioxygenase ferredoxin reductase subunit
VIVGGGLAAARTAEQLRRSEYAGPIAIVSDEDHLPYDRPPLSKEVLRAETDDVTLKPAEFYEENDITVQLGKAARSVDTAEQTVTLADGSSIAYDRFGAQADSVVSGPSGHSCPAVVRRKPEAP